MDPQRRPTSSDVARRAGVSRATVSYVLNNAPNQTIPADTRRRVQEAATELGYTPNAAARALRGGDSRLVLLINPGIPYGPNLAILLARLDAAVAGAGRSLVQWHQRDPDELAITLTHLQPSLVIALGALDEEQRQLLERARIPLVAGGHGQVADGPDPGAILQIRELAAHGHRRVGHLSSAEPALAGFSRSRIAGVRRACLDLGLAAPEIAEPDLAVDAITEVLSGWTQRADPVTAVACYNDVTAAACLAAARRLGLAIPDRLSVIGLDDDPTSRFTDPPLTTIHVHLDEFADALWARAAAVLDGHRPGRPPAMRFSLVPGATV